MTGLFIDRSGISNRSRLEASRCRALKCISLLLLGTILIGFLFSTDLRASVRHESSETTPSSEATQSTEDAPLTSSNLNENTILLDDHPAGIPDIDGKAYILYDTLSGTFLVGDDCDTTLSPASTTKVLTIIIALESLDLNDTITVTSDMYDYIPNGYVRLGLVDGEEISVRDAIFASLIISANDACSALAFKIGGSLEGFAKIMNERAAELGCTNTHFTNPFGYSDPNHTTTVHDMALMMEKALEFDLFIEATTTLTYIIEPTNKYSDKRTLNNGNRFISTTTYSYDKYVAGKTGYTDLSGHTIVAAAKNDGRTLIGVIFGASASEVRYGNLIDLFEYGFSQYTTTVNDLSEYANISADAIQQVRNAVSPHGILVSDTVTEIQPYITVLTSRSLGGYSTDIDLSGTVVDPSLDLQKLNLPICRQYSDGTRLVVGTLIVTLSKETNNQVDSSQESVEAQKLSDTIRKVIIILVLIIALLIAFAIFLRIQKNRKALINRKRTRIL